MSFVLVMPKEARDALRKGGGVPEAFWGSLSGEDKGPILVWPHEMAYKSDLNCDGKDRPVDLPAFFGLGSSSDDEAAKRANERLLAPLLKKPMVFVTFLDEREKPDGYALFSSFEQITKWIQRFDAALRQRHDAEATLGTVPRVLVLVAREERPRARQKELDLFNASVGMGCAFSCAYYMGRNLQMAQGQLFHAWDVWDLMLSRLLMAFVLSEQEEHSQPFYNDPGLKLWRSADCVVRFDEANEANMVNLALSKAASLLRAKLSMFSAGGASTSSQVPNPLVRWAEIPSSEVLGNELNDVFAKEGAGLPKVDDDDDAIHKTWRQSLFRIFARHTKGAVREKWRQTPKWGWSDFDAQNCLEKSRDDNGERWRTVLKGWKKKFPSWRLSRRKYAETEELRERKEIYSGVHASAANVEGIVSELRMRWSSGARQCDPVKHWTNMAEAEQRRKEVLGLLADDSVEFERARRRYVGWGKGVCVWAVVTLFLGWAGYRVMLAFADLAGKSAEWMLIMSLSIAGCVALGAFVALAVVTLCHHRTGTRGMEELISKSKEADKNLIKRDEEAREIVLEGVAEETGRRLRGERFRAWVLLKRLYRMLEKELAPRIASGRPAGEGAASSSANMSIPGCDDGVRSDFLKATRMECILGGKKDTDAIGQTVKTTASTAKAMDTEAFTTTELEKWWKDTFIGKIWKNLSSKDNQNAGFYPARDTVSTLRSAMDGLIMELRKSWRAKNRELDSASLIEQAKKGVDDLRNADLTQYASAPSTGEHVKELEIGPAPIYCNSAVIKDTHLLEREGVVEPSGRGGYELKKCPALETTDLVWFMYQEWPLEFEIDQETGKLKFKGVPDA